MVKILGICDSPHRKSCYKALETALEAAKGTEESAKVGLVELRAKKMSLCTHCNKCLRGKPDRYTVFKDDMTELYDKFYEADDVTIAPSVCEMNITVQLCAFLDRFHPAWLRGVEDLDLLTHEVGAGITVDGIRNGGQGATINSVINFLLTQGVAVHTDGLGMYSGPMLWNPGDGSTEIEDPDGFRNYEIPGREITKMSRIMKETGFQYFVV